MRRNQLIIISIIIFLALILVFVSDWFFNRRNHDLKVLGDIAQIRSALEVAYTVNGSYPAEENEVPLANRDRGTEKLCQDGFATFSRSCEEVFSPLPNDEIFGYTYQSISGNQDYLIRFQLYLNHGRQGISKGFNQASSTGIFPDTVPTN